MNNDDYTMLSLRLKDNYKKSDITTYTGDVVARCLGSATCNAIANSILNIQSNKHFPLDMDDIRENLDSVCVKINSTEPENNFNI